jgi:hypothetical protein
VYVTEEQGWTVLRPIQWQGGSPFSPVGPDSLVMVGHPRFTAVFLRDAEGCARALRTTGYDLPELRLTAPDSSLLLEDLYTEAIETAAPKLVERVDEARLLEIGAEMLRWPSLAARAARFLEIVMARHPTADAATALGRARVAAGDRPGARLAFETALERDPGSPGALEALRMLGARAPAAGAEPWELPFSLDDLFAAPSAVEIEQVWEDWQRRDLRPLDVEPLVRRVVEVQGIPMEARVFAHRVHGFRHLGVVLVPVGATPGCCAVLVEAKGVSPAFFPLDVPDGLTTPLFLGDDLRRTVLVAPTYRGERLILGPDTLLSEGDRSDAWDGATDDLLAFLAVALERVPEADPQRVCVFGRSRGGTVALLAGLRSVDIDCTVAWAAPTDWFEAMGTEGWSQREHVEEGLRRRSVPGEVGGQFIDYFLRPAIEGRRDLAATRLHLIASSPLYFAGRLRSVQAHWGEEDGIVPVLNGRTLAARAAAAGSTLDARFHPGAGHDQDRVLAPLQTASFLREALFGGRSE